MARCPFAVLPAAPIWRLFVRSPRQLCAAEATRIAYRSVVLSRRPPDIQPVARLPRRQTAGLAHLDRGYRCGGILGQEHGGCCGHVARARCQLAQRTSLAVSPRPSGSGRSQRRFPPGAGDADRWHREKPGQSRPGASPAWASSLPIALSPEHAARTIGLPVAAPRKAVRWQLPTRHGA